MNQLEAHEVPVHKVFSCEFDFHIPTYQRPYAWEAEQATQLLEDLTESLDRADDDPYFLGSIVLVKKAGSASAEVIDGQQRLTTMTILLAVLRDLSEDPKLRLEIDGMLSEPGHIVLELESKPRLTLRKQDAAFFRTFVQEAASLAPLLALDPASLESDSQRSIAGNAKALHKRLSTEIDEARRLLLIKLILSRTFLVVVSTPDLSSAHRIFSVMNARGLDLSPTDIFKAEVARMIPGGSEAYTDKWEDAEDLIGRDAFLDLFQHIRTIVSMERAKKELLKEFPDQVLVDYRPSDGKGFVDEVLVPYTAAYAELIDANYVSSSGAEKVNAWIKRLSMLDNNDWRPAALWALRHHHDDPAWLDQFFEALERVAGSMFVRRVYTTPRVTRICSLLAELKSGLGLDSPSLELTRTEMAETLTALDGEVYLQKKTRKYVLLRLDETLASSPGVDYAHKMITVEHVLPQTPADDSPWLDDFDEDERAFWTHRLANLVLLNTAKNSEAGRHPFELKKAKYFTGKHGVAAFALTTQVLGQKVWTPDVLAERQTDLVAKLAALWRLT